MKFNTVAAFIGLFGLFCAGSNMEATGSVWWVVLGVGCALAPISEILKASRK